MAQLLCFVLPPLAAMLIARIGRSDRRPAVFALGQACLYAFLIGAAVSIVMLPAERASVALFWDGHGGAYPYVRYGRIAMVGCAVAGVLLGVVSRLLSRRLQIETRVLRRERVRITPGVVVKHALVLLMLVLTFSYTWGLANYGNVSFEEMVFHLNMPLKGTSPDLISDYLRMAIGRAAVAFVLYELLVWWPSRRVWRVQSARLRGVWAEVFPLRLPFWAAMTGIALWLAILFLGADQSFTVSAYLRNQMRRSSFIEEHYVDPGAARLTFPEKKRNLITIFVESAETSSQDRANGGYFDVNYIPEMTRLARENVSFSHSQLLEGAAVAPACGWTIAGMVAQTAGLPLKLYAYDRGLDGADNAMWEYDAFLPGATALGDLLKAEGYRTVFMCGSDLTFGGRRNFLEQHGAYEARDYLYAKRKGVIPEDYRVNWGMEDSKLYAWAKEELTALADGEQPFHFMMLTVDTHSPAGYVCPLCPDTYEEPYANVLACSSAQLDAFISWCQAQPFYENTSIVITGDHTSMVPDFYDAGDPDIHSGNAKRKVYNAFLNSAVQPERETGRLFTTMDFFPTMLASIGVEIEGERLGLGTNLFSGRETLAEEYGYETLFDELNRKSLFYDQEILYP